jgi:Protein of unknown function (DUF1236)
MRYMLISAAAAMALVGAGTLGNAQAPDDKSKSPTAEVQGPASDGKAKPREPGAGKTERSQQPTPKRAAEPRSDAQTQPKAERRTGAEKDPGKDRPKATQQRPKDQPKSTDAPQPGKDQQKATQQPPKDQPKSTEGPQPGKDQKQGDRAQVTEQQRSGVREQLVKQGKVEKTRINVTVNIGTTIPRSVRLHTLPVVVFGLAPAYRGYSYIVLEDETICIVDAGTYTIIDVIPAGSQRADRPSRAQLVLSADQMNFIIASVPKDRTTNVRVRLALGAEAPRDVELLAFPAEVLGRVPEVGRYRYIVAGGDVVIVDPNDNAVVLVINE